MNNQHFCTIQYTSPPLAIVKFPPSLPPSLSPSIPLSLHPHLPASLPTNLTACLPPSLPPSLLPACLPASYLLPSCLPACLPPPRSYFYSHPNPTRPPLKTSGSDEISNVIIMLSDVVMGNFVCIFPAQTPWMIGDQIVNVYGMCKAHWTWQLSSFMSNFQCQVGYMFCITI